MAQPTTNRKEGKIKRVLLGKNAKDAFIFLFFVLICSIFWFVREMEETINMEVTIPVKIVGVPRDVIITEDIPSEIRLNIHDKGLELLPYYFGKKPDTLRISFSSLDSKKNTGQITLQLSHLQNDLKKILSDNTTIQSMTPDALTLCYNRGVYRRLPVVLNGKVNTQEGFCIPDYHFQPDSVTVYAPQQVLDTMYCVSIERLHLDGINKSVTQKAKIQSTYGMRAFPDTVSLSIEVDFMTKQTISVPIMGVHFPTSQTLSTFPSRVALTYLVPERQAKNVGADDFAVIIDYNDLIGNTGNYCQPRIDRSPDFVVSPTIEPSEVGYLIEIPSSTADSTENVKRTGPTVKKKNEKRKKRQ